MKKNQTNDAAVYLFHQGTNFSSYEFLGAHCLEDRVFIRVWAPNAHGVSLAWNKNSWTGDGYCFEKISDNGVWELSLPSLDFPDGTLYKIAITRNGVRHLKADPYAFRSQTLSETASVFWKDTSYTWNDSEYLSYRACTYGDHKHSYPMNVYECHLGSWQKEDNGGYLSWNELAERLSVYVKQMGFTHIELMPVAEHPYDGSWGYQVCSYYSPTARFGHPLGFKRFVDRMHQNGIGVIMDWVPAHFPKDEHGLFEFDGLPLYEYQGYDRMEHKGWGTRYFDVGRNEVQCFLISNLFYWAKEFHVDGFRMDAVSSMLYLDFDKGPGEWNPNPDGGRINPQAVSFFKRMNSAFKESFPDVLLIAEEANAEIQITGDAISGLGFDYKWNMGWMNDTLSYFETDPIHRKHCHQKLTFPMMYAFNESFILPFSHDEVVHGKKTLLDKQPGTYEQKFLSLRTMLAYMMACPGKKLSFMGNEYAPFSEWNEQISLEWFMLDYPAHKNYRKYVSALNTFYLNTPPLWENDRDWNGFRWSLVDRMDDNLIAFERIGKAQSVLCVFNLSPVDRPQLEVPVAHEGPYRPVFYTNGPSDSKELVPVLYQDGTRAVTLTSYGLSATFYLCEKI